VRKGNTSENKQEVDLQSQHGQGDSADQNLIAALSHALFAIAIELGSGEDEGETWRPPLAVFFSLVGVTRDVCPDAALLGGRHLAGAGAISAGVADERQLSDRQF
jgi:hypothetical protein